MFKTFGGSFGKMTKKLIEKKNEFPKKIFRRNVKNILIGKLQEKKYIKVKNFRNKFNFHFYKISEKKFKTSEKKSILQKNNEIYNKFKNSKK